MSMSEACEGLEQQRSKLQNELTTKDNQISYLTGQLNNSKSTLEKELSKVSSLAHLTGTFIVLFVSSVYCHVYCTFTS